MLLDFLFSTFLLSSAVVVGRVIEQVVRVAGDMMFVTRWRTGDLPMA